jgi:hypothetical protein
MTAEPHMDRLQGVQQIYDIYNAAAGTKFQIDKSRASAFVKCIVPLMRYIFDLKHIKGLMTPMTYTNNRGHVNQWLFGVQVPSDPYISGMFARDDLIATGDQWALPPVAARAGGPSHDFYNATLYTPSNASFVSLCTTSQVNGDIPKPVKIIYQLHDPTKIAIALTESPQKDEQISHITNHVSEHNIENTSASILNIIDLNIMPINVHSLMREIPLANLYNYAYTFDRSVVELLYDINSDFGKNRLTDLCTDNAPITSARDALVQLLINPYKRVGRTTPE